MEQDLKFPTIKFGQGLKLNAASIETTDAALFTFTETTVINSGGKTLGR